MLHLALESRLRQALAQIVPDADLAVVMVRPCPDPKFGDYQTSALMAIARTRKMNPRQLAAQVMERLDTADVCERVEVAGAGYLNFHLKASAVGTVVAEAAQGQHHFFHRTAEPKTLVIDFSSPNVAKSMHIGHIRSTVLGDAIARVFRALGHRVITDNHIGDWGTQFGKLIVGWKRQLNREALAADPVAEMERLYKTIHAACETDPALLDEARRELVALQKGDPTNLDIWRQMIALSQKQFDTIYGRLKIQFDHTLGESFYNDQLNAVIADLRARGIARESEGAVVAFFDDIPELKEHPALIQKSDGAANYATTDLATLLYRIRTWHPDEIIYVTDGRQQLHFRQLFAIFRRWQPEVPTRLQHVWFGSILGEDDKPYKTRSGETVKLADVLDEAEDRAYRVTTERNPGLTEEQRRQVARIVGLGAVKYSDLLPNRQSDYVFNWDKMLALNGNTAPYLQYAYARIQSILRRESTTDTVLPAEGPSIVHLVAAEELTLAKHLLHVGLALEAVAAECRPNYLCNYLYELAGHFARFYESCPVLKAEAETRSSRLQLCQATGHVLRFGLELLGIETADQM